MAQQQIIFKLAERCNINCTYCYYFHGGERDFLSKPARTKADVGDALSDYLKRTLAAGEIDKAQVIFHGGEPLLYGKRRFDALCSKLRSDIDSPSLDLCLQTNATLIDSEWIGIFEQHDVKVCTSLDGPQSVHDSFRVDHRGRGTYQNVRRGIDLLIEAKRAGRLSSVACLSVIQPKFSGRDVFIHLVNEVGFDQLDFLFPDVTHDNFTGDSKSYGRFLIEAFDEWFAQDNPVVNIRVLRSTMSVLLGGKSYLAGFGSSQPDAFTVRSDGAVELDDFLRVCGLDVVDTGLTLKDLQRTELRSLISARALDAQFSNLPLKCADCDVAGACKGGQISHRFKAGNGFEERSVFCEGLYDLFVHVAKALVEAGEIGRAHV